MSLLDPIPVIIIQGNNYTGVSVNRRDDGTLLFSRATPIQIHVNGEGNIPAGLRGGLVQEGNDPSWWIFIEHGTGSAPLWLTRIVVTPPVVTTSAPPSPVESFPDLPGLAWDVHLDEEYRTLVYGSNAPGWESRIAQGPTQVTRIKMHYNFLRQNVFQTIDIPAILTQTANMGITAVANVTLGLTNFANQSPRWSPSDSTVIFCAGTGVYKMDHITGVATLTFTAPDGNFIDLSNVVGNYVLAFTSDHIYKLDVATLTLQATWAITSFSPLISMQECAYDSSGNVAWVIANRTSVGADVYKLDLIGMTFTRITFTGNFTSWSMVINPVASTLDLVNGTTAMSISIPGGAIATSTMPGSTTGALAADPDGYFWTGDNFATDNGTPSWKIDATPTIVLTVGTYEFAFQPSGTPRPQGYAFANVAPTIVGPLTYPVVFSSDELSIIRGFWRSKLGDGLSFTLPLSKITKNPADPDLLVRFEKGSADFDDFLYQLYELQEISFVTVAG